MSTKQTARSRSARVPSAEARARILEAARALLRDVPFHELTVDAVMARADLARTVFYRHFDDLTQLAPDLLPDSDAPLVERIEEAGREDPDRLVDAMLDGLVGVFAEHGALLRAIDAAAARDPEVAARLDPALQGPRKLIARLLAEAPHPPPDPAESSRLLMAAHRAYLLEAFGDGHATPAARRRARAALGALWRQLLR